MSQFCAIYDSSITFKYNEGSDDYNDVMKMLNVVGNMTVLGGLANTKIPTNQKFWNSISGVNVMNPLAPHQKQLYTYCEVISSGYAYVFYIDQK